MQNDFENNGIAIKHVPIQVQNGIWRSQTLQQVLLNIITNASDALEGKSHINIMSQKQ
jgi:C4-dicarboxylate-specific signal transduction histidine kinase